MPRAMGSRKLMHVRFSTFEARAGFVHRAIDECLWRLCLPTMWRSRILASKLRVISDLTLRKPLSNAADKLFRSKHRTVTHASGRECVRREIASADDVVRRVERVGLTEALVLGM
jgi:hypothetical protein